MEPRKCLRLLRVRWETCVGQASSRNGLAGQDSALNICAEETAAFQCNVVQRQCNIRRNVVEAHICLVETITFTKEVEPF